VLALRLIIALDVAVRHRRGIRFPRPLLLVTLLIELLEQEEEHDGVHADPPDERLWIVALDEEQLEGMDHDCDEL